MQNDQTRTVDIVDVIIYKYHTVLGPFLLGTPIFPRFPDLTLAPHYLSLTRPLVLPLVPWNGHQDSFNTSLFSSTRNFNLVKYTLHKLLNCPHWCQIRRCSTVQETPVIWTIISFQKCLHDLKAQVLESVLAFVSKVLKTWPNFEFEILCAKPLLV